MAELIKTLNQEWRRNSQKLYANEFRKKKTGALQLFLDAARRNALVDADVRREAVGSTGNTIKIRVMKDNFAAQVATERSCTPVNNRTDSDLVPLTWVSLADGFTMFPTEYDTNEIKFQEHYDKNMISMINRLMVKLDQLSLANLETNKTQVVLNNLGYNFNAGHAIEAGWNERQFILNDLGVMLDSMNFGGDLRVVGSVSIESLLNELGMHGTYNDVNYALELNGKEFFMTNQLNESGKFGAMFAVAGDQVDILSRVSRAEYHGVSGVGHQFGTTTLPGLGGLVFGTHVVESIGDVSTPTGQADMFCDKKIEFGFSIDVAFVNAYESNQTTAGTGIIKSTVDYGTRGAQTVTPTAGAEWKTV